MLLVVGRIGRAHGVAGEATIEVRTDVPDERFYIGAKLFIEPPQQGLSQLTITSLRDHNRTLLLKFAEVADRTAVEKLRDTLLKSEVDMADEHQGEDDYHVQQLFGLKVVNGEGALVGTLDDVINLPGQDLLSVINSEGRELLIPFVREFVPTVDLDKGEIVVTPPAGLLNLGEVEA